MCPALPLWPDPFLLFPLLTIPLAPWVVFVFFFPPAISWINRLKVAFRHWIFSLYLFQVLFKCHFLKVAFLSSLCLFQIAPSLALSIPLILLYYFSRVISSDVRTGPFYSISKVNCVVNLGYFGTNDLGRNCWVWFHLVKLTISCNLILVAYLEKISAEFLPDSNLPPSLPTLKACNPISKGVVIILWAGIHPFATV